MRFHAYPSCTKTLESVSKIFSKFGTSWSSSRCATIGHAVQSEKNPSVDFWGVLKKWKIFKKYRIPRVGVFQVCHVCCT